MTEASPKPTKLTVLAFNKGADGELLPAFEARKMRNESTAIRTAKELARRQVGVVT